MEVYLPIILTTASTLVVMLVGWGLKLLGAYIAAKTKNEALATAFNTFSEIVDTTVKELDQTFKKAAADGKFTEEEKVEIKNLALDKVNTQLPDYLKTQLGNAVNDLETFVDSKIEATVRDMKCTT
jgi:hypothetical protein